MLVDAGRSCKQLMAAMDARGIDPRALLAVLVTHEHTDHISGLRVLLKKLRIPLYATAEVLERLRWDGVIAPDQEAFTVEAGRPFSVGSLVIDGFDTPHDLSLIHISARFRHDGQLYHAASRTWYNNRLMARAMTPYCFLDNLKTITDGMDAAAFKAAI